MSIELTTGDLVEFLNDISESPEYITIMEYMPKSLVIEINVNKVIDYTGAGDEQFRYDHRPNRRAGNNDTREKINICDNKPSN